MKTVDLRLEDTADQLDLSVGELMRGIRTGRFERVTQDDIVYGDKGDPLFFRVDTFRAMAICGSDFDDVTTDMGTVEEMSQSGGGETRQNSGSDPTGGAPPSEFSTSDPPADQSTTDSPVEQSTGGQPLTETGEKTPPAEESSGSPPATQSSSGPPATQSGGGPPATQSANSSADQDSSSARENPSSGVGDFLAATGTMFAVAGGFALLTEAFSGGQDEQGSGDLDGQDFQNLTRDQIEQVYVQGWNSRMKGGTQNPYPDNSPASAAFEAGWMSAQEEIEHQKTGGVRVGGTQ